MNNAEMTVIDLFSYNFKMPPAPEMKMLTEMLEMFKRLPCIWDQAHHLYHCRNERDRAYAILLQKYRTIYVDATKEMLKKKIDNMRNAYRREYKKVLAARAKGAQPHIPVLWYYHLFTFLDETRDDTSSCSVSEITEVTEVNEIMEVKIEEEEYVTEVIEDSDEEIKTPPPKKIRFTYEEPLDTEVTQSQQAATPSNREETACQQEVTQSQPEIKSTTDESEATKESETFGRTIGLQLKELEPMQRYIAEKIISDVIFYGRLRKLDPQTSLANTKL
ncbi:uncharacterized protein LOC114351258 [Ostrinia furnacalis]|uniref:uncharacterized protein LOC114351258 n=1 Tax=Ostrinia furnacalis TaxID=93504 RepID=UPI00103C83BE|nr:uncharacterized protein LOC114351258 [Ostrinia furnacalis]